ncbi:MAG: DUF2087 domain-containing protein [candidate division Zixibacteria bacterium]|nr:DUF2087 domain-containing protein [candidate division Zixibacteria bacterium]
MNPTLDRFRQLLLRQDVIIGKLTQSDMRIMLIAATLAVPKDSTSTEREVTERLYRWVTTVGSNIRDDAVELRRYLVDCRCLRRDPAGRAYTRSEDWPTGWKEIATELESLDIVQFAEQVRIEEAERRAARKKAALEKKDAGAQ